MTAHEIVEELESLGNESYKKTMLRHGAKEPFYGVKIEDMKKIQKRVKKDYRLALDLYATGVGDAMYLAGLIADDAAMTNMGGTACKVPYAPDYIEKVRQRGAVGKKRKTAKC